MNKSILRKVIVIFLFVSVINISCKKDNKNNTLINSPALSLKKIWITPNAYSKIVDGITYYGSYDVSKLFQSAYQNQWANSRGVCKVLKMSDNTSIYGFSSAYMTDTLKPWLLNNNIQFALETYHFDSISKTYSTPLNDLNACAGWGITVNYLLSSGGDKGLFFAIRNCGLSIHQAVSAFVAYVNLAHSVFPNVKVGEIFPFGQPPVYGFSKSEMDSIIAEYKNQTGNNFKVAQFEPYLANAQEYNDLKTIINTMKINGTETGLLLHGLVAGQTTVSDQQYYNNVMSAGNSFKNYGINPNHYNIQSWIQYPHYSLPETPIAGNNTLTQLVKEFTEKYVLPD